jgi:hypothetical protein
VRQPRELREVMPDAAEAHTARRLLQLQGPLHQALKRRVPSEHGRRQRPLPFRHAGGQH